MKSIFVVCDKDENPFFTVKGKEFYSRVWAFKNKDEATVNKKSSDKVVEYRPVKEK